MTRSTTVNRTPKAPARATKARPKVADKPTAARVSRARKPKPPTSEERHAMIREAAYFRAERRGFAGGSMEEDWLEAEKDIDRILAEK
jgi:hypothetical protein